MYAVVEFLRANNARECALVPVLWLVENNTRCYWPRTKNDEQFRNLVRTNVAHEVSWPIYAVHRVLYTGDDYDLVEQYLANTLENGTSEDGITMNPITQKKLAPEDTNRSDNNNENRGIHNYTSKNINNNEQETEMSTEKRPNGETQLYENSRKKRKKQHKRHKNNKKNKRRKDSTSCSNDTEEGNSQDQENDEPLSQRYGRSLTGLQRQDISINAKGRDISVNADFSSRTGTSALTETNLRTSVNITPQKRDVLDTPRFSQSDLAIRGSVGSSPLIDTNSHTTMNKTTKRSITIRDIIDTPHSSQSNLGFRGGSGITTSEQRILQYLEQINRTVDQNQIIVSQILRLNQALSQAQNCTMPQGLPHFPIATMDIFEQFDETIQNEEHRTYMIQRLASVGGSSQRQAVMNMLKFLMTNSLAMEYNWAGREKKSFKQTNIMKIVNEAAKIAFKGNSESSDTNIASAVKDWLKLATSRHMYSVTGKKNGKQMSHPVS